MQESYLKAVKSTVAYIGPIRRYLHIHSFYFSYFVDLCVIIRWSLHLLSCSVCIDVLLTFKLYRTSWSKQASERERERERERVDGFSSLWDGMILCTIPSLYIYIHICMNNVCCLLLLVDL